MKRKTIIGALRGWIPKEPALRSDQTITFSNHLLKWFQFARLFYGVMLGALLIMPFGVYHSRVEPYIIGSLWGYNLPIGYIGLMLGILVIFFPKTALSRKSSLGVAMVIIGLLLIGSVYLVPRESFINWINGTSFSGSQIDIDYAVGNAVTLFIGMASIIAGIMSRISVNSIRGSKSRI